MPDLDIESGLSDRDAISPHATPFAWWRETEPAALARLLTSEGAIEDPQARVTRVRPFVRDLCRVLDAGDTAGLIGASVARSAKGGATRDATLADDLLASALLIEAIYGDPAAEVALAYLRRQRGLAALEWEERPACKRQKARRGRA